MQISVKIRNIPYGYEFANGCVALHPQESVIVCEIFNKYRAGKSLLTIAEELNSRMIAYMVGVYGWNKARLKRLLEDDRYLGKGIFPSIINEETYAEIQRIKDAKNLQKHVDRRSDIFQIQVPVKCPKCRQKMRRRYDSRYALKERWNCQNETCQMTVIKDDASLIEEIVELMNCVIGNPELIELVETKKSEEEIQFSQLDTEISLLLSHENTSKSDMQRKILEYASLKYKLCQTESIKTQRLKETFANATLMEEFSVELFDKTVKELCFHEGGSIEIIFINDKRLKKEKENGSENCISPESDSEDGPYC